MKTQFNTIRTVLVVGLSCVMANCATDGAKKLREDKKTTVGFLGAAYRPTGDYSVGATFMVPQLSSGKGELVTVDTDNNKIRKDYTLNANTTAGAAYYHRYVCDTSAFFWGLTLEQRNNKFSYNEYTNSSTDSSPSTTEVEFTNKRTLAGIGLGWDWMWDNGFSLGFDFGPRWSLVNITDYQNDGTAGHVNESTRDDTVHRINNLGYSGAATFGGSGIIGYSF